MPRRVRIKGTGDIITIPDGMSLDEAAKEYELQYPQGKITGCARGAGGENNSLCKSLGVQQNMYVCMYVCR